MNGNYKYIALLALFFSCSDSVQVSDTLSERAAIFPDYTDITIPANIAPLNFSLETPVEDARAVLSFSDQQIRVKAKDNQFVFPVSKWKKLLSSAAGNEVKVVVQVKDKGKWVEYAPVKWNVAAEPVDPYIAYRLIAPGYTLWNKMGLYQRNLENYTEMPIIENKMSGRNHSSYSR